MKVSFEDARSGRNTIAVLKLYDRRFSPSLRRTYNPSYDTDAESAWHEYVRDGKAPALFAFLDEKRRLEEDEGQLIDTDSETDPSSSEDDWDRDSAAKPGGRKRKQRKFQTPAEMREKKGKRERIVQWKALDLFNCETRAYAELAHLQERYIPNLLAQVHLTIATPPPSPSSSPSPDQPTTSPPHNPPEDPYFQIPGILLSFIPGFNLTSLPSTPPPPLILPPHNPVSRHRCATHQRRGRDQYGLPTAQHHRSQENATAFSHRFCAVFVREGHGMAGVWGDEKEVG